MWGEGVVEPAAAKIPNGVSKLKARTRRTRGNQYISMPAREVLNGVERREVQPREAADFPPRKP